MVNVVSLVFIFSCTLQAQRVVREEVETDLIFLGLIVLDNRLKPASSTEMATLKKAGIRTIMVTGMLNTIS